MSFSQSMSLGDSTLFQLDICEGIHSNYKNSKTKSFVSPAKRSKNAVIDKPLCNDSVHRSPSPGVSNSKKVLDVIDESPTEKTSVLGQTIRERLKNASTSKKSTDRKQMRRSRSDPLCGNRSKQTDSISLHNTHGLSEGLDSIFDASMEWSDCDDKNRTNKKSKLKLDEKFELNDDFDKYLNDIQTPKCQNDRSDETKKTNLIDLCDSDEMNDINISEIQRLMRTNEIETEAKSTNKNNDDDNDIEWDDSAYFNDLLASQPIQALATTSKEADESLVDNAADTDCVSMHSFQKDDVNDALESCFLEVSMHLSNLNATEVKSTPKTGTQLNASIFSTSISAEASNNAKDIQRTDQNGSKFSQPKLDNRSIDNLKQWNCSAPIIKTYKKKGIQEMFEWQLECLSNPKIKDDVSNLLYSAPTSAGKTFVSEVLTIQTVLKRQKKVIIILPFISVVREKMYTLQDLLRSSGIRVEGFFGGHTAPGGFDGTDIAICTIEKANAIVNRLLEQKTIDTIGMIVVDEVHLISDPNRGYILELLLTKILYCSRKLDTNIRVVAMSATLPNAELVQRWLSAEFYRTDYRPIELREMIKIGGQIYDRSMNPIRILSKNDTNIIENDPDNIAMLCIETIVSSASVIVFCPSKDWCEKLAIHVAQNIYKLGKSQTPIGEQIRKEINLPLIEEIKGHLRNSPAGLDSELEKTISYGVAFHHAGLTFDERDIIESAFCKLSIRVIIATSTLSSGVNLPARRVIIRTPMFGGKPMCSLTYKQMIGRAGRMGKDTEGESILICANNNARIGQELIGAILKPITSCLAADNHTHLKRALLEIIASGVATTRTELESFVKCTLFHSEHQFEIQYFNTILTEYKNQTQTKKKTQSIDDSNVEDANDVDFVGKCMRFLERYEFIRLQFDDVEQEIRFVSTRLGYACLAASMPPSDGFFLFSELQKARENFVLETELHAVYLVTPFSVCYQLQDIDWLFYLDTWEKLSNSMQRVGELVGVREAFLVKAMRNTSKLDNRTLQIHKRFYTALVLHELINECPLNKAAVKYKLSRGTLQSLQQTTSTFAGIVKSFCKALNWDLLALIVSQFQDRIFFGVHQDLVELMKISVLNGQRARALFNAGYQTLIDISKADIFAIEKCLIDSISFDVQKRNGETNYDAEQRNKHRLLFVTGRAGLSAKEAAQLIIDEARHYIRSEMGIENIAWSQQNEFNTKSDEIHSSRANDEIETTSKRRIPLDDQLETPSKRRNCGQTIAPKSDGNSTSESSSELSDVDSINLDSSTSFYNDENDDFMEKLQSTNDNRSAVRSDQNGNVPQLKIIDVACNANEFNKFVRTMQNVKECGFALSIARVDPANQPQNYRCLITSELYVYGISIAIEKFTVHFLTLQDEHTHIDHNRRVELVRSILKNPKLTLQMNDAKTQLNTLLKVIPNVCSVDCQLEDSQIAQWLIQPEDDRTFSKLITLYAPKYVDLSTTICEGQISPTTSTKIRSAIKACITRQILHKQTEMLRQMENGAIYKAFKEMEMPIQKSLLHMEQTGMALDRNVLERLNERISDYIGELETEIFRLNAKRFAVNSSRAVAQALKIRKKNGAIAAKCTRVQLMQCTQPMAKLILEHRSLHAILSKSIQPLIRKLNDNNRIYGTSYSFTQTGRISMHEPNLQNIAKDFQTEFIEQVFSCRSAFAVSSNRMLISADFCQLELRVLAHLSEDQTLIGIFHTLNDVFISIAAKWNKVYETDVTDKMRNDTKQICYGIIYGMGTKSLATAMKCNEEQAQSLHESFHQTYPGIRNYMQKILSFVREKGYVETIAGRRRYMADINSNNPRKRAQAERQAINTTIQGSAADIAKYAILRMERNLQKYQSILRTINGGIQLVLHLHDELLYEVASEKANQVLKILKSSMENCAKLLVPLKVKVKKGQCWATMTRIE